MNHALLVETPDNGAVLGRLIMAAAKLKVSYLDAKKDGNPD